MNETIVQAIQGRKLLSVWYNGGTRLIEPHCYGLGKAGQELLRCYQVSGYSSSNQPTGWKLMTASNLQSIMSVDRTASSPRPGYNPNGDKAIPTVYAMI